MFRSTGTNLAGRSGRNRLREKDSPAQQTPFRLQPESISSNALGVTANGHDYVYLVDEALSRLELTNAERKAILAAREAAAKNCQ